MSLLTDIVTIFPDGKISNSYVRVRCPYHKGGMERRPSMSILTEPKDKLPAGYAHCFTCGWVGTFADIAADFGLSYVPDTVEVAVSKQKTGVLLHHQTALYKKDLPYAFSQYLAGRGIPDSIQRKFKVYQRDDIKRVYFPIFSREGQFLFATARTTIPGQKAFFIDAGRRTSLAYIEEVDFSKPIAVCEAQINALSYYAAEFCRSVATIGATNWASLEALKGAMGPFLLSFDNDEAGIIATRNALELLGRYRCKVVLFSPDEDVNDVWIACNFNKELFATEIEKRIIAGSVQYSL